MKTNSFTIIGIVAMTFAIGILIGTYSKNFTPKEKTVKPVEISQNNIKPQKVPMSKPSAEPKSVAENNTNISFRAQQVPQKISFSKYTNYIEYCIRKNWRKVSKDVNEDFSMNFNLGKDGKIISYGILTPAKSKDFQEKAIKTVIESTPFEPIPDEFGKDVIGYQIHIRGNDMNLASYATAPDLPNIINYKFIKKKPLKIDDAKDVRTMSSYPAKYAHTINISMQIQRNWNPPLDSDSRVQIRYDIDQHGNIVNERVISSSGSQEAVDAAIKALKSAKATNAKEYMPDLGYWFYVEPYRW